MQLLKPTGRAPFLLLLGITLFLCIVMLYFGIRFKGYRPANNVTWLPASEGLGFKRFAVAYTDDFFPPSTAAGKDAGLTIEIAFRSLDLTSNHFGYLLCVYAGDEKSQLLIGQWRHWLLIMNGADHDGRLGTRKVVVDIGATEGQMALLTIASGGNGTAVYLDGKVIKADPKLQIFYPYQTGRTCLILGNSVYGRHPWHGLLAGLALYDVAMDPKKTMDDAAKWAAGDFAGLDAGIAPKIRYRFDLNPAEKVSNMAGIGYPLHVPERMVVLKKDFLGWPKMQNEMKWSTARDIMLNFLGFMPLGWMLCVTLGRLGGFAGRRSSWLAVGLAFAFSLSLEIAQAWIPSRDSSLIDLIMNTLGAAAGCWIYSVEWLQRAIFSGAGYKT
ncbi:MAG: VanZ family protein [Syntrophobacteraceae bacterium]